MAAVFNVNSLHWEHLFPHGSCIKYNMIQSTLITFRIIAKYFTSIEPFRVAIHSNIDLPMIVSWRLGDTTLDKYYRNKPFD